MLMNHDRRYREYRGQRCDSLEKLLGISPPPPKTTLTIKKKKKKRETKTCKPLKSPYLH